ncbi:MAG: hypothetical protein EAX90_02610 [Candidatus Heimdallarchaeota archaeon]|nr:hypothetical protein [Candidatus Heimdallarchaeota archaeon]
MVVKNSSIKTKKKNIVEKLNDNEYCNDCVYTWCSKRSEVIFCTMKTKGLFECRSCILKMMSHYEKMSIDSKIEIERELERIIA